MTTNSKIWVRIALINLCIVATLGTIMRYKIGFAFPYLDQKYLQEAHSHFAFTGWISFLCQGYGPVSIFISLLSILNGYVFAFFGMKDAALLSQGKLSGLIIILNFHFKT